ncbi:uncharacterized protein C10orf95 homolog isoform X2 [Motacilla alba alba]|uniref:uncharacterized protein C10orf95 homolog isoform X2 n=1 Tax=Motacilla alba alba TaxID=1094192 RepID=UPI0018D55F3D|nr:uncharacterized protein C10orf95 homolog isoform X2 [Motacilla alba alba]
MYQSSFVPREYYPAMIPPSAYAYPPLRPGRAEDMSRSVMFPSIHMHNFYSRPITFVVDRNGYPDYAGGQRSEQYRDTWPEGFTMRGELQWGKLGKVFGPRKDLPEFVKDDLRRVYGTYPRTSVSISYRKGEFLVKGDPKTEDQEYAVEKKVIQQAVTPSASEADDSSEDRNRKKKKKLRH